jgi:hypothetical protein
MVAVGADAAVESGCVEVEVAEEQAESRSEPTTRAHIDFETKLIHL